MALAKQAQELNSSSYSVAKCSGIPYPTIRKYRRRLERGLPLFKSKRRPQKLDVESRRILIALLRENMHWDRRTICRLIRDELINTTRRRYALGDPPAAATSISRVSVWRIAKQLRDSTQPELLRAPEQSQEGPVVVPNACVCM